MNNNNTNGRLDADLTDGDRDDEVGTDEVKDEVEPEVTVETVGIFTPKYGEWMRKHKKPQPKRRPKTLWINSDQYRKLGLLPKQEDT